MTTTMVGFYDGCSTLLSTETIRRPCAKLHHRPEFKFVPRNPNSEFRPPPARELLDEARVEAAASATRAVVAAALVAVLVGRVAARDPSLVVQRGDERDYARGKRGPSAVHSKRSSSLCTHHRPNSSAGPSTAGSRRTKRAVKKHYRVGRRARPRSGVSRYARRGSRRRGRAACPSGSRTAALPIGGGRAPRRAAAAVARGAPRPRAAGARSPRSSR